MSYEPIDVCGGVFLSRDRDHCCVPRLAKPHLLLARTQLLLFPPANRAMEEGPSVTVEFANS